MSDDFKRQNHHKKKQTPDSWRRAKGTHSRVRLEKKSAPAKPKIGYRTSAEKRGKHPSGYEEVLVHNTNDLEEVEEGEAARIASKVGERKREMIVKKAEEEDIKVLNAGEEE
ncbi:MAG: 50S ribosomal protein L32e [Candidatus Nanohaloarchaea archaeon]